MNKRLFCVNFSKFFSSYGIPRFLQNMQKEKSRELQTNVKDSLQKAGLSGRRNRNSPAGYGIFYLISIMDSFHMAGAS